MQTQLLLWKEGQVWTLLFQQFSSVHFFLLWFFIAFQRKKQSKADGPDARFGFAEIYSHHWEGKICHISHTLRQKTYRGMVVKAPVGYQFSLWFLHKPFWGSGWQDGRLWLSHKIHALTAIFAKTWDFLCVGHITVFGDSKTSQNWW